MTKLSQLLQRALDILLPRPPIETLSPEVFLEKSEKALRVPPDTPTNDVYALFSYHTPLIKETVRALKYKGSRHAAKLLAHALYPLVLEYISDTILFDGDQKVLLVPIPLSKKRLRERGYNQTQVLAEEVAMLLEDTDVLLTPNVLVKTRDTKPQTETSSREERLKNVVGCFSVPDEAHVAGKHIIVLDDVTTTGATIREALDVLRRAGARRVVGFAIAH